MKSSLDEARGSAWGLIEFVALAEFDIDYGATIRVRYPPDDHSDSNNYLCEQMLPDRSEGHADQQTIFFMNRKGVPAKKEEKADGVSVKTYRLRKQGLQDGHVTREEDWVPASDAAAEILSFVPGKQKGCGELFVKTPEGVPLQSIPITDGVTACEIPSPFEQDRASLLLLRETGCGYDLGLLLNSDRDKKTVVAWAQGGTGGLPEAASSDLTDPPFLFCLNRVKSRRDPTVRRGSIVKSLAWGCRNQTFLFCFDELMNYALDRCLDLKEGGDPKMQTDILKRVFEAVNDKEKLKLSRAPSLSAEKAIVWRDVIKDPSKAYFETEISVELPQTQAFSAGEGLVHCPSFKLKVPLHLGADEVCSTFGSVAMLLDRFKEGVMTIINAVMSGKRVLFLSYQRSAAQLCEAVTAAAGLVSPPLSRLHETRVFPYTSLTCLDVWNSVEGGWLVGATNPVFEQRGEWWDVLCDLDTGKVKVGAGVVVADTGHASSDQAFVGKMLQGRGRGERFLRFHFRAYLEMLLRLAAGDTKATAAAIDPEGVAEANATRIRRWQAAGVVLRHAPSLPARRADLAASVHRLRGPNPLREEESLVVFQSLIRNVRTDDELLALLALMPQEADGLFPIALGLFHPSEAVRLPCVAFLRRLDALPEGKLVIHSLNTFLLLAYERNAKLMPVTQ